MPTLSISGSTEPSVPVSRKRKRRKMTAPSTSLIKPQTKSVGRPKSNAKMTKHPSTLSRETHITATQNLPLVVGNFYMKVENFNLEELLVSLKFKFHYIKTFYILN